jgi:hypothetical protein
MEDLPEAGNLLCGSRHGDWHWEGRRCRGDLLQVLDTGCSRFDTGLHPCSRVQDNGCRQYRGDLQQEGRRCRGDLQQEGQVKYDKYFKQL